jgi:hydrogenase maturation protease
MIAKPRSVRLLVCGNAERGDDGAALAAVATLLAGLPPHLLAVLDVRRCEGLDLDDLIDLPADTACVIADAVVGLAPGDVVTIPLADLPARDAAAAPIPRSSHILPIGHLVAIAEIMRDHPLDGSFVGIGGRSFGFGRDIGGAVRAALPAYRAAIESALIDAAAVSGSLVVRSPDRRPSHPCRTARTFGHPGPARSGRVSPG